MIAHTEIINCFTCISAEGHMFCTWEEIRSSQLTGGWGAGGGQISENNDVQAGKKFFHSVRTNFWPLGIGLSGSEHFSTAPDFPVRTFFGLSPANLLPYIPGS